MCVILFKLAGQNMPTLDTLQHCIHTNPDGSGIMSVLDDQVKIRKGFFTSINLAEATVNLLKDKETSLSNILVFHFRKATSGLINRHNCHPFPVSSVNDELKSLSIDSEIGFAHNGVFRFAKKDKTYSDTQVFVRDYLKDFSWGDIKKAKMLLRQVFAGSKVVMLHHSGEWLRFGTWHRTPDGYFASNTSYGRVIISNCVSQAGIYVDSYYNGPLTDAELSEVNSNIEWFSHYNPNGIECESCKGNTLFNIVYRKRKLCPICHLMEDKAERKVANG